MIALWMLYAIALAALVGAAGWCADVVCRSAGRPSRYAWAAAMAASLLLPAAGLLRRGTAPAVAQAEEAVASTTDGAALAALLSRARSEAADAVAPSVSWQALDGPLVGLWLLASLGTLGWLILSRRRLRQALRDWRPGVVRGESVLVTPDVGPAVVGEEGGQIVLPAWALALDETRLALMLAHERSHLAARDPQLLTAAAIAAALAPWNPALWWQLRRLRLAVEIDCDRRVLRRHPDVSTYGALLLDVAGRATARRPLPIAALSSATTSLERRIQTMTMRRPRHLAVRALALGALSAALVAVACETPRPTGLKPESRVPLTSITNAAPEAQPAADQRVAEAKVRAAIAEHLPAVARGTGQKQQVWFVLDANGRVTRSESAPAPAAGDPTRPRAAAPTSAIASSLDPATIQSIEVLKLAAGRVAPDSVDVIWVQLKATAAAPAAARASAPSRVAPATGEAPVTAQAAAPAATAPTLGDVMQLRPPTGASAPAHKPLIIVDGQVVEPEPSPIFYVDDVESTAAAATALPRETIESVNVYKGEMAVKLYGERGRNGVVQVKTKKPAATKP